MVGYGELEDPCEVAGGALCAADQIEMAQGAEQYVQTCLEDYTGGRVDYVVRVRVEDEAGVWKDFAEEGEGGDCKGGRGDCRVRILVKDYTSGSS